SSPSASRNALSYRSLRQRVMLRPCHLFSFDATSHDTNARMKASGSGTDVVDVNICRSVENFLLVSGFPSSAEKYTDAVTAFSSTSIPAFWHACLTIAWVFWRGALVEVWKTSFSCLPSLARMPSDPRFQPA